MFESSCKAFTYSSKPGSSSLTCFINEKALGERLNYYRLRANLESALATALTVVSLSHKLVTKQSLIPASCNSFFVITEPTMPIPLGAGDKDKQ